jgi:general secretion pathway protein C
MNNAFNPGRLWPLVWIGAAAAVAKLTWVAAAWIIPLPTTGVDHRGTPPKHALRYRYRLASEEVLKVPTHTPKKPKSAPRSSLSGYKLIGIYSTDARAVVTLMHGTKSLVITNSPDGGKVEGYRLKEANATAATFVKGDQTRTLKLFESKKTAGGASIHPRTPADATDETNATRKKGDGASDDSSPVRIEGDTRIIKRTLIEEYAQNPDKIWKNIGLYEVKNGDKLEGFKVRFVRKGSPFEKLGLKRGDIIKAINGEPIVDYATPMQMLRYADTIEDLAITVERNHEEQELKYEVK